MSSDDTSFQARLEAFVGRRVGAPRTAPDPVNVPMIRHWVEALGDANPIYLDDAAARATGRPGVIAPPTMMQAWGMPGLGPPERRASGRRGSVGQGSVGDGSGGDDDGAPPTPSAHAQLFGLLDGAGFTSIVATNCEQVYVRELQPGDRLTVTETIESVSPEKRTALGNGHFLTMAMTFRDQSGEVVGVQNWSYLKFRPGGPDPGDRGPATDAAQPPTGGGPDAGTGRDDGPLRPRPAVNRDNRFWFDAAREHRLVIQRCGSCGRLRHPPGPCCPACQSFDWDTVDASGRGRIHSFVVCHHPQIPSFDYPLVVALIELDEGVRLLANVAGIGPGEVEIGMPVVAEWVDHDPELALPAFRPAAGSGA